MPLKELAERRNILHQKSDPQTVLNQALNDVQIGRMAVVSSFGAESVVLLHMVAQIDKAAADTNACCHLRKVKPLNDALSGFDGWITGRKRYQSSTRANVPLYEKQDRKIKVNPLAHWTAQAVADYINAHDLPRHPLVAKGYPSIGCLPCTTRVGDHEDPRAGRWRDADKTECGIHFAPVE